MDMDLKTPISLLQEYLVKEGVLPCYQLIHGNGTHEPIFIYEVKAKGISAIGKGRSKKEAKHEAAKSMLLQLQGKTIWKEEIPLISPHVPSVKGNMIGALQEYCARQNGILSHPKYEYVSDEGDIMTHNFVVRCTVSSYSAEGRASTKQQAKQLAAEAMLSKVQNVKKEVNALTYSIVESKKELTTKAYNKTKEAFQNTLHERQDRPLTSTGSIKNLLNFADYFKSKIGPRSCTLTSLKDLNEEQIERLESPETLLKIIMRQLGYNIKFEYLNSKDSEYFLYNLTVGEIGINCIGVAKQKLDAQNKAAVNVLKILILMSKS